MLTVLPYIQPSKRPELKFELSEEVKLQKDSPGVTQAKAVELAYVLARSSLLHQCIS